MIRRLFAIASAVSLLLCAACVAGNCVHFDTTLGSLNFRSTDGFFVIARGDTDMLSRPDALQIEWSTSAIYLFYSWLFLMLGWALARRVEQVRAAIGHCRSCGYDLAGNTSGVCPECGTAIPRKSEATA